LKRKVARSERAPRAIPASATKKRAGGRVGPRPRFSVLTVAGSPRGAQVMVRGPDGFSMSKTMPAVFRDVPPGLYRITISKKGYQQVLKRLVIEPGEDGVETARLKKQTVAVRRPTPTRAKLLITKRRPSTARVRRTQGKARPMESGKNPPAPAKAAACVKGKITTMYRYKGETMLSFTFPARHGVGPGCKGHVLAGSSSKHLANGAITVQKCSGNRCIANTSLSTIGRHRRVCVRPK